MVTLQPLTSEAQWCNNEQSTNHCDKQTLEQILQKRIEELEDGRFQRVKYQVKLERAYKVSIPEDDVGERYPQINYRGRWPR